MPNNLPRQLKTRKPIIADTNGGILQYLLTTLHENGRLTDMFEIYNDPTPINVNEKTEKDYWAKWWGGSPDKKAGSYSTCGSTYPNYKKDMKQSDKLFGGIGAWSIYWTEIASTAGVGDEKNYWLKNLKEIFHINDVVPTAGPCHPTPAPTVPGGLCGTCPCDKCVPNTAHADYPGYVAYCADPARQCPSSVCDCKNDVVELPAHW